MAFATFSLLRTLSTYAGGFFGRTVETEIIGRSAAGKSFGFAQADTIAEKLISVSNRPHKEGD
jgi:hypothetical protein